MGHENEICPSTPHKGVALTPEEVKPLAELSKMTKISNYDYERVLLTLTAKALKLHIKL